MSFEVSGSNILANIPLINTEVGLGAEGLERCDPLFRNVMTAGLSAAQYGFNQSPAWSGLKELRFGELFNGSDEFVGENLKRSIDPDFFYPEHARQFDAGIYIAEAALTASRLFTGIAIDNDYTGPGGVGYIKRSVIFPIEPENSQLASSLLNASAPLINLQARVFAEAKPKSDYIFDQLSFAAASVSGSMAMTLVSNLDYRARTAKVEVSSASREGDFVGADHFSDFRALRRYAQVARQCLGNSA